jgi:hypothetical protein
MDTAKITNVTRVVFQDRRRPDHASFPKVVMSQHSTTAAPAVNVHRLASVKLAA